MITAEIFAAISRRQSADLEMEEIDFATLETCLCRCLLAGTQPSSASLDAWFPLYVQPSGWAVTARANASASFERFAVWPRLR